ncbi:MAG: B12-binding domain-containing radical SAM protein [Elusimicrobia bacterium]|nr:B12-binding domain-containing radical SAM protein [Elusimicrobiota bacterium]
MKILLIDPPGDRFLGYTSECLPLGLSCLASYLKEKGHPAFVYNADHAPESAHINIVEYSKNQGKYQSAVNNEQHPIWQEVREVLDNFRPDLVGISVMSVKILPAKKLISLLRKIDKNMVIVCGGQHPTIDPELFLRDDPVDFVVRGEGELTLAELIEKLSHREADYENIKSLSFLRALKIIHVPPRQLMPDLAILPLPEKDNVIFRETYNMDDFSIVMTSRGCPYACGFCGSGNMWHRTVRYFPVEKVIAEIEFLKKKYQVTNIKFMDDSFSVNSQRVEKICLEILKAKLNITWSCLTRVNLVDDGLIRLMKKAGCTKIDIGIESGNPRVLQLIDKEITIQQIERAVKVMDKYKIFWAGFFMFGFPTETEEEIMDTLYFMKKIKPGWANLSIFTPYPGTKLYDLCLRYGIINFNYDPSLYMHQRIESFATDKISKERFSLVSKKMLHEFNSYNKSLFTLLKRARSRNYHRNPRLLSDDFKKLIKWSKTKN